MSCNLFVISLKLSDAAKTMWFLTIQDSRDLCISLLDNSPLVFSMFLQLLTNLCIQAVAQRMVYNQPLSCSGSKVESVMLTVKSSCFSALHSVSTFFMLAVTRFVGQFSLHVSQFGPLNQRKFKWLDPLLPMSAGLSFIGQCCQVMLFSCLIFTTLLDTNCFHYFL